jgi:hypothetical protein
MKLAVSILLACGFSASGPAFAARRRERRAPKSLLPSPRARKSNCCKVNDKGKTGYERGIDLDSVLDQIWDAFQPRLASHITAPTIAAATAAPNRRPFLSAG